MAVMHTPSLPSAVSLLAGQGTSVRRSHILHADGFSNCRCLTQQSPHQPPQGRKLLPSKRYLTIIRTGAAERGLHAEYLAYLDSLQHYQARTLGRRS